jgi:2-isopropylmalate synthase
MQIHLFDTTLRDGTQSEGLSLSVEDKLKIARLLDGFGIQYIEGGYPGSNPKDIEFFRRARGELRCKQARLTAFGSTRKAGVAPAADTNLRALVEAGTPTVCIYGKSWPLHVEHVLATTLQENLAMIGDSVRFLRGEGKEVIYDAEHFFDGFRADRAYALDTLRTAAEAGADWVVLCDTNGGSLPGFIQEVVAAVRAAIPTRLGIHTHNDADLAVANALAAVEAGCTQVQGTMNGWGER